MITNENSEKIQNTFYVLIRIFLEIYLELEYVDTRNGKYPFKTNPLVLHR